jgi:hypothetical protein
VSQRPDYAAEIRRTLVHPRAVCDRLGLMKGALTQSGQGVTINCPAHGERTPSCSVTVGKDGTLRFRCFGCQATGDVLTLVATVHDLDLRADFKEVLLAAAELAGLTHVVDELNDRKPYEPRPLPDLPEPGPDREYPDAVAVASLWALAGSVADDPASGGHLVGRGLDARTVASLDLLRAIPNGALLPLWARYRGRPWTESGHRMITRVYDAAGAVRSVRAWRVEGDAPAKRLPPGGHKATGLVMANRRAQELLAGERMPPRLVVVAEGEPDFITCSVAWPTLAVFGITSGSWSDEFAQRIPLGSEVVVRTHNDAAGDKYAGEIIKTVKLRAVVRRSEAA